VQIVGKVRTTQAPWVNHGWHSTLYVSSRGLATSLIPDAAGPFSMEFDFRRHELRITCASGDGAVLALRSESVASFYNRFRTLLGSLGISPSFSARPNEVPDPIPFGEDEAHHTYVPEDAHRFWQALLCVEEVFQEFRSQFVGKASPVHFFWGSFDLAVSRFSGRPAPEHPGHVPGLSDAITREAYSHEVSSCGFWPGNEMLPEAAFYSYVYPTPPGFEDANVSPIEARFHPQLREFVLRYEDVRRTPFPRDTLLRFLQSTYDAAANLGGWDRKSLEESPYLEPVRRNHVAKMPKAA
jgi:hypothetical protein